MKSAGSKAHKHVLFPETSQQANTHAETLPAVTPVSACRLKQHDADADLVEIRPMSCIPFRIYISLGGSPIVLLCNLVVQFT